MSSNSNKELPNALYRAEQVRELDRIAIEQENIPGPSLMERAGLAAFDEMRQRWPDKRMIGILCGAGNNGGDGFVLARLAHEAGYSVSVWQLGDCAVGSDAEAAFEKMQSAGVSAGVFNRHVLLGQEVIVDALLGTGLSGEIKGAWLEAISAINAAHEKGSVVLALDIPSGLHADTGAVLGAAVNADCCITFIGMKQGMLTGAGPDHCGTIVFDDLEVPSDVYKNMDPSVSRLDHPDVSSVLLPRSSTSNKGDYGHVLVVGGEQGMAGAAQLAGTAAARTGAGLVSLATRQGHAAGIAAAVPELMCHGVEEIKQLVLLLQRATVIAIGPGLGRGQWAQTLFSAILNTSLPRPVPIVVDADALNLLAAKPSRRDDWILTPHPGEAARLLGVTVDEIQANRFNAITQLQDKYGGVVVLKGKGTLIVNAEGRLALCSAGNPGMACGGMGDVLTGIIAGLLAQGASLEDAAKLGVCLHAEAGDLAARDGLRGLLASDLFPQLRQLMG